ncbi:hypothetical protein ABZP36_024398, partial [Zizania latifolia]
MITTGTPLATPLADMISNDPILGGVKLIAEAWDVGGLYQVGHFPHWNIWSEWNGSTGILFTNSLKGQMDLLVVLLNACAEVHIYT